MQKPWRVARLDYFRPHRPFMTTIQSPYLLRALLVLAGLYTLYFAQTLLIPLVLAVLLALLLSPLVSKLKRLHIPRTVSSVVLLSLFVSGIVFLGIELIEPVRKWASAVPQLTETLEEQLESFSETIAPTDDGGTAIEETTEQSQSQSFLQNLFGGMEEPVAAEENNELSERMNQAWLETVIYLLSITPFAIVQMLTVFILVLFLLVFGPDLIAVYVRHSDRVDKSTLTMFSNIRTELAHYVLTISVINAGLALGTAALLYFLGVEDALFWGVFCGLANFAPYVGALVSLAALGIASFVQFGAEWQAVLPPLAFFALNSLEANFLTPTILGSSMRLNPLTIIVWMLVCGWMWGAVGVLLSVPLLVCFKMTAKQLGLFPAVVALIETPMVPDEEPLQDEELTRVSSQTV